MVQNNPTLIPDVLDDFSGNDLKAVREFAKKVSITGSNNKLDLVR